MLVEDFLEKVTPQVSSIFIYKTIADTAFCQLIIKYATQNKLYYQITLQMLKIGKEWNSTQKE